MLTKYFDNPEKSGRIILQFIGVCVVVHSSNIQRLQSLQTIFATAL
jgi:hypothetical protein